MKIAVLCLPGIGDSLMATPMIRVLRKNFPNATIDLVCMFSGVAYCFKNNKNINTIYKLSLYNAPLINGIIEILKLRKNNYDISILTFPSYRREYHIVQFLLGARRRISHVFTKGFWNEWNFLDSVRIPVDESVHNVINNLHLLNALSINQGKTSLSYDLELDKNDIQFGESYIKQLGWKKQNTIALHPGSINSAAGIHKRWSIKNFSEIAKKLIRKKKKILIFVGPFEIELGEKIIKLVGNNKNCKIVTNTTFGQSLGILCVTKALISNDNGFAHLANSLHVKGVVLFGPTNPLWCSPVNKQYAHAIRTATFTPWFRNDMKVTHPPKGIQDGMSKITVATVLKELEKLHI